tara:strand:- start:28 stop:153 length:126 start_codon:yes stop_codon:yes gene_type:complete
MKYKLSEVSVVANLFVLQDARTAAPRINDDVLIKEFFIVEV